jgi:hypothetical protein
VNRTAGGATSSTSASQTRRSETRIRPRSATSSAARTATGTTRVLHAREHGECGAERERDLPRERRLLDETDAEVDRHEDERVRKRVGEHARRVYGVGDRDGERCDGDREPGRELEPLAEQVRGYRRKRDERRM